MGDIYESLAVVVFLWPAFITAGAAGYMGLFYHRPLHGTDRRFCAGPVQCFLWVL